MSMYDGVRSHASEASTAHRSRLAAAGLAVFLSIGVAGTAHAGSDDGRPSDSGIENGSLVAVCHAGHTIWVSEPALSAHLAHDDELGACESGSESENDDSQEGTEPGGSELGGSEPGGSENGFEAETEDGADSEGGTEDGSEDETTEDETPATVQKPSTDKEPAEKNPAVHETSAVDETPAADKNPAGKKAAEDGDRGEVLGTDDDGGAGGKDDTVHPDEILGADDTPAANRPAATVLPQTGAGDRMALQVGTGLGLLAAGAVLLLGRRRVSDG